MWYAMIIAWIVFILFLWMMRSRRGHVVMEGFKKKKKKRRNEVDEEAEAAKLLPNVVNPPEEFFRVAYPSTKVLPPFDRTPTLMKSTFGGRANVRNVKQAAFDNHASMLLQHMSCMSIPKDSFEGKQMTNAPFLNFRLFGSNTQTVVEQALGIIKSIASRETEKMVQQSQKTDDPAARPPRNTEPTGSTFIQISDGSAAVRKRGAKPSASGSSILLDQIPTYAQVPSAKAGAPVAGGTQAQTATQDTATGGAATVEPIDNFQSGLVSAGFDFVADYKQRLRELLRLLKLLHQEAFLMNQFLPGQKEEVKPEAGGEEDDSYDADASEDYEVPMSTQSQSESMFQSWEADIKTARSKTATSASPQAFQATVGRVQGPIYLFLANLPASRTVEGYLYFPSITKDGRAAPNLDFLGRSHRWMHRLMFGRMYYEDSQKVATCQLPCLGLPKFRDVRSGQDVTDYTVQCGCIGNGKQCKPKGTARNPKGADPPRNISFVAYKFNAQHPHIASMMDPAAPQDLRLNILPANTVMYHGCGSQLISPNMQYYLRLDRHQLTLYENVEGKDLVKRCPRQPNEQGKPLLTVAFRQVGVHLSVEEGQLRVATAQPKYRNKKELINEEEPQDTWTYTVSSQTEDALSLVLMDDGTMRVFNSNDQDVTSSRFKDVYNTSRAVPKDANFVPDETALLLAEKRKWQKKSKDKSEYAWRLEHLRVWLLARRLYRDTVNYINPDSLPMQKAVGKTLVAAASYDPSEDYAQRIIDLIGLIKKQGLWKDIQDHQRVIETVEVTAPNAEKKASDVSVSDVSYAQRISELVAYLKSRGLWKEPRVT